MFGEATGKTGAGLARGGSSSRVLALPEGLSLGPSLPWFILLEGKCEPRPMPDASVCTQDCTRAPGRSPPLTSHTLPLASRPRGKPAWAISPTLSFSAAFLEVLFIFSVSTSSPPCHCFSPCGLAPAAHAPGTSLVKVTVASVPLTGYTSLTWPPCSIWRLTTSSCAFLPAWLSRLCPLHDFFRLSLRGPSVEVPVRLLSVPTSDMMHLHGSSPSSLSVLNTFESLFWCLSDLYSSFLLVSSA